jgi:hypothetical protein
MYTQQNNAVQWPGTQGRTYPFNVYPILTAFAANQLGNYIFAKLIGNAWHAVYIGEGDIKERTECHKREEKVHQMGQPIFMSCLMTMKKIDALLNLTC